MLRVKTKIGPSKIHGLGLIADEFIPDGTVVWEFDEKFDVVASKKEMDALPKPCRDQMYNYCYRDMGDGLYVICGGDARFMNHEDDANTRGGKVGITTVAHGDIHPEEEITCNYYEFDADAVRKLGPKRRKRRGRGIRRANIR